MARTYIPWSPSVKAAHASTGPAPPSPPSPATPGGRRPKRERSSSPEGSPVRRRARLEGAAAASSSGSPRGAAAAMPGPSTSSGAAAAMPGPSTSSGASGGEPDYRRIMTNWCRTFPLDPRLTFAGPMGQIIRSIPSMLYKGSPRFIQKQAKENHAEYSDMVRLWMLMNRSQMEQCKATAMYSPHYVEDADVPAGEMCNICFDQCTTRDNPMEKYVVKTPVCGHYFHNHCLHPWIPGNETCPTCRCPINDFAAEMWDNLFREKMVLRQLQLGLAI